MSTPDPSPLQWDEATITSTPQGYELVVPMYLDDRAVQILEAALPKISLSGLDYAMHAQIERDSVSVEPGELRITSADFDIAPEQLRMLLDNAAQKARKESAEAQAQNDVWMGDFLGRLRGA